MTQELELQFRSRSDEMRQKYIYFILTATGACIGFAVTQSRDAHLTCITLLLGLAMLAWAMSFFCGCRSLFWKPAALMSNIEVVKATAGSSQFTGNNPELQKIAYKAFHENYERAIKKFSLYMRLQFGLFIAGSIFFLAWHVLEIWFRTYPLHS